MDEKQYYENINLWASHRGWDDPAERKRFSETISLIPSDVRTLIDLGCGNGMFLKHLGQARPEVQRTGLDRSQAALKEAEAISGCPVGQGNVEATPFARESFDCVTALEILEHLPESAYKKALVEIERIAKNHILISTPYDEVLIQIKCPECRYRFNPNYHMRNFNETGLRTLFNKFSFSESSLVWEEKQPLFYAALHGLYSWLINPFHSLAQCPQCGYRKMRPEGTAGSPQPEPGTGAKAILKRILPGKVRHRWIVCRYDRRRS